MKRDRADLENEALSQVEAAFNRLHLPPDAYLRWPWPALHQLTKGIAPGNVVVIGAFTGTGKTTFVASAVNRWLDQGRTVYAMPLESKPDEFRTHLAAQRAGVRPGDVLSGALYEMSNGEALMGAVSGEMSKQIEEPMLSKLIVSGQPHIDRYKMQQACEEAAEFKADCVIVDHVDHIEGTPGQSFYEESVRTLKAALKLAQGLGLRLILTSQLNNQVTAGHRLARYQPPQIQHFYMGQHKAQVATQVIGLYRPIRSRLPDEDEKAYRKLLDDARHDMVEPQDVLARGVTGVVKVKDRNYGAEGQRIALAYEHGRILDRLPSSLERGAA